MGSLLAIRGSGRSTAEPAEGYESRWASRRAKAIWRCRHDDRVLSWSQAQWCALDVAFSEGAPWTAAGLSEPWTEDASALVSRTLRHEVAQMFDVRSPSAWQAALWLRGQRAIDDLRRRVPMFDDETIAVMSAKKIYPTIAWPPTSRAPAWTKSFWDRLVAMTKGAP